MDQLQFTDTQAFVDDIHNRRIQLFSDIWALKQAADAIYAHNQDLMNLGPECLEELANLIKSRQQSLMKHKSLILQEISETSNLMLERKQKSMDHLISELQKQLDENDQRTQIMLTKITDDIADTKDRSIREISTASDSKKRKDKRDEFFNPQKVEELKANAYLMKFSEVVALWVDYRGTLRYRDIYDYLVLNSMKNFDPENCSLQDLDYIHSQFDPNNEVWDTLDAHLRDRFLYGDEDIEEWRKLRSIRFAVVHHSSAKQKPRSNWSEVIDAGLAMEFLTNQSRKSSTEM